MENALFKLVYTSLWDKLKQLDLPWKSKKKPITYLPIYFCVPHNISPTGLIMKP